MHIAMVIDLETLGLQQDCVIVSVGFVVADLDESPAGDVTTFTAENFLKFDGQKGRTIQLSTLDWWPIQGTKTIKVPYNSRLDLREVLAQISRDFLLNRVESVWSKGADFDIKILEHAYKQYQMEPPWNYSQVRCFRTIDALASPLCSNSPEMFKRLPEEPMHNALGDAQYQMRLLREYWHRLGLNKQ